MRTLYPHQKSGIEFLQRHDRCGLFDDQGLGKTITALCAIDGLATVVCPSSVVGNWKREAERWLDLPDIEVRALRSGSSRLRGTPRVVITTHDLLRSPAIQAQLASRCGTLIADEAQFLRNRTAARSRVFYETLAPQFDKVWVLSGTPMPNHPTDLWLMGRTLWPDRFPEGFEEFRDKFCVTRPAQRWGWGPRIVGARNLPELKARLRDVTLRRLKSDELDLPPLRHEQIYVDAVPTAELADLEHELKHDLGRDPTHEDYLEHAELPRYRRLCGEAKVEPVAELILDELRADPSCKRVLFCYHVGVALKLQRKIHQRGFHTVRITGDVTGKDRDNAVYQFQTDSGVRVAVCQIVAGGTGVTLTASDDLMFVEPSFVPGEMAQARDRIHRIGQHNSCRVRFASLRDTADELVMRVLRRKTAAIREVLRG